MSYFNGPLNSEDFEDGYSEERPPSKLSFTTKIAIMLVVILGLGTTLAANISLNGGSRKEFGQGIYQIKACDQWVGIGLTSGSGSENLYVKNLKLYGFDPRLCLSREFVIKLFPSGSTTPLPLYVDETTTGSSLGDTTTALKLIDTSTAYSSSFPTFGIFTDPYHAWSAKAVTLVNALGTNVGYYSKWMNIRYATDSIYTVTFIYPAALVAQVASVTIESAKYSQLDSHA